MCNNFTLSQNKIHQFVSESARLSIFSISVITRHSAVFWYKRKTKYVIPNSWNLLPSVIILTALCRSDKSHLSVENYVRILSDGHPIAQILTGWFAAKPVKLTAMYVSYMSQYIDWSSLSWITLNKWLLPKRCRTGNHDIPLPVIQDLQDKHRRE